MHISRKMLLIVSAALLVVAQATFAGGSKESSTSTSTTGGNVTLTVFGEAGQNTVPVEWMKPLAEKQGINIQIVGVPFTSVYQKLKTEFVSGTGAYDMVIFFPAYLGDFAGNGYLQPLNQYFSIHDPKMDDVVPAYRQLYCTYDGKTYALAYDGDILNLYYLKSIFSNSAEQAAFKAKYGRDLTVPKTWNDLLQVAQFLTRKKGETLAGKTLDHNVYGFGLLGARGFAYAWWSNIFASLGGVYFDENLKPEINSAIGVKALDMLIQLKQYAPPDTMSMGYEQLKDAYLQGRLATMIQWSDVWKKANDPSVSKIVHDAGIAQMPGVRLPNGTINYRAAAPVSRVIGIPTTAKHPKQAFWLASELSLDMGLRSVSSSETGEDPYRISQFDSPQAFEKFGTLPEAKQYLSVVRDNLSHMFPDLNIPGSADYLDALDIAVTSALSGAATPQAALDTAAARWNQISEQLGKQKQTQIYDTMLQSWKALGFWK